MRINRLELIAKINALIVQREEKALASKAKAYDEAGKAESDYVRQHASDWAAFANRIRARVRKDQVVTHIDVPEGLRQGGFRSSVQLFQLRTVRDEDYAPQTQVLINLLAVLQASPDEFVTTSTLDRMGAPLRELMRP